MAEEVVLTGRGKSVTITRTADTNAYTANDVVGAATGSTAAIEFTKMGQNGCEFYITSAVLEIASTALISGEGSYDLHLYGDSPASALGDNAAFDLPAGDRGTYRGKITLGTPVDLGSTLRVELDGINKQITLSGESIFAYLVTSGGYTPTSGRVYRVSLRGTML